MIKYIVKDLYKMNTLFNIDMIKKESAMENKIKKKIDKIKHKQSSIKIFKFDKIKYNLPNIKLNGKYLKRYNDLISFNNYNLLYQDLIDSGYYIYDMKLKQHLSKCGLNRTKQLYGTCWLDSIISCFVFSPHIKNQFIKLIDYYMNKKKIHNIKLYINKINKKKFKLSSHVEKNEKKIFELLISILYTVFCDIGIRNDYNSHNNYILTNFAIDIKNLNNKKDISIKTSLKDTNLSHNSYYAFQEIIFIFNKYINSEPHLLYYKDINALKYANKNHINNIYFNIEEHNTYITSGNYGYYYLFKNITISMNSNNILKEFTFNEGYNLLNLDMVNFFILSCTTKDNLKKHIPIEIKCSANKIKTKFKLESAAITIKYNDEISTTGHAITGIICDGEYYVYDPHNNYFKIDWTNMNESNTQQILNYYMITSTASHKEIVNNSIIYSTNVNYIKPKIDIFIEFAIYYNDNLKNTSTKFKCNPSRPL